MGKKKREAKRATGGEGAGKKRKAAGLATVKAELARASTMTGWTVQALESALLERFPRSDALDWDRTGLLVGNPHAPVTAVALALDATPQAVRAAASMRANVLLTHHPAFLDAPQRFGPAAEGGHGPGSVVWEAIRQGVALMNFHTALDVSDEAARLLPGLLKLEFEQVVDVVRPETGRGFGQLCSVREADRPLTLRQLAARCTSTFGRMPRVWGDPNAALEKIVTCTGSQGDLADRCLEASCDCLVCGEIRYHDALEAAQAGLAIVELGHDVSEIPLCAVLAASLGAVGFPSSSVKIIDQTGNWWTPEAMRR